MENQSKKASVENLDLIGVCFSGVCALHCLITPLLPLILPSLTVQMESEWIHLALLVFILPTALVSFVRQRAVHNHRAPLVLGVVGLFFLIGGLASEKLNLETSFNVELVLTVLGSLVLIFGHLLNIYFVKRNLIKKTSDIDL